MLCILFCCIISLQTFAQADRVYDLDVKKELGISLPGLATLAFSLNKREQLEPIDWRIVQTWNRSEVPSYDRPATFNNSATAKKVSDYMNLGLMLSPGLFIASKRARQESMSIATLYSETLLWTTAITQLSKVTFQRRRPFVFNEEAEFNRKPSVNARMSFISGHTSASAAMAFLSASLYRDFYPDRNHSWSWTLAATLPMVVGYTRFEAGAHYLTDVAAGYVVGALIGYVIPKVHKSNGVQITPTSEGLGLWMNITL